MEIFGDFWRVFGDFQGVSERFGDSWIFLDNFRRLPWSFREFRRVLEILEIFKDFWIVSGDFQGVSESFVEF